MTEIEIVKVKGIGPASAKLFVEGGFSTAADIAKANVQDLARIPGVGEARAQALIDAARALLTEAPAAKAEAAPAEKKPKDAKAEKKAKSKDKKEGNPKKSKKKKEKKKKKKGNRKKK